MAVLLRSHVEHETYGEVGAEEQADAVLRGQLTRLELNYFDVSDSEAEVVAEFLKHDENVKRMCLDFRRIGAQGVKVIAEALRHNKSVERLRLRGTQRGSDGGKALIDAFNHNVSIKKIYLEKRNDISAESQAMLYYLTGVRNRLLIPAAVSRAALFLIASRRTIANSGDLAIFPKEIVKMIAIAVWETRRDSRWIQAVSNDANEESKKREFIENLTKEIAGKRVENL